MILHIINNNLYFSHLGTVIGSRIILSDSKKRFLPSETLIEFYYQKTRF